MQGFHFTKITFALGFSVLALSAALFGAGVMTGNRPGSLVFAAFALLAALSLGLLRAMHRAMRVPVSIKRPGDKSEKWKRTGTEKPDDGTDREDPGADILSETAGELRTSVEVIQEELEEILDDEIPADKEHIESLYNETDRIRKIIDGMEQLSRAQALARSLKRVPVRLEPLLNDVIEKNRINVRERDVAFGLQCEPGLAITADPDCLAWIIGNLISNAVGSIRNAGGVTVTARHSGKHFILSVRDTGTGIRRGHIPHLFERFFRGSGSGIGMGLAIVKELVDACGGTIEVETGAGKGSTFTVQLPSE